jgi:hypothetical protein
MKNGVKSQAGRLRSNSAQVAGRVTLALALACLSTWGSARMTAPMVNADRPTAGGLHWGDFSLASTPEQAMAFCEIVLLRARFRFSRSGTDCIGSRSDARVLVRLVDQRFEPPAHATRLGAVNGTQALIVASSSSNARAEQVRNEIRAALSARAGPVQWPLPPTDR